MLRPLQLLLPALLPSWGFFDYIQPSPRIQYQLLNHQQPLHDWQEFRPRPTQLSLSTMLLRLLNNQRWNETLFLMSCAERIVEHYNAYSEEQILQRITRDWHNQQLLTSSSASHVQFRLVFVQRQQHTLNDEVRFVSRTAALSLA